MQNFVNRKKMVNFEFSNMAKVAQLVESQVVVLVVAGSIPVLRPKKAVYYILYGLFFCRDVLQLQVVGHLLSLTL